MRKYLLIPLILCILAGCSKTEDNPNLLKGIGMPVFEGYSTLYETDDRYYAVEYRDTTYDYSVLIGDKDAEQYLKIITLDENGDVLGETEVKSETIASPAEVNNLGFYMKSDNSLYLVDWSGSIAAATEEVDPNADITALLNGCAVLDGDELTIFDENLAVTAEYELEVKPEVTAADGNDLWIVYQQKEDGETFRCLGKIDSGAIAESYRMPQNISAPNTLTNIRDMLIACEDGWLYGWNGSMGIYRWQYENESEEPVIETVISFPNSAIVSGSVTWVEKLPGEDRFVVTTAERHPYNTFRDPEVTYTLLEKVPDRDLSEMTVLTLACSVPSDEMQKAVNIFNRDHTDVYIKIVSYEEYGKTFHGTSVGFSPNSAYDRMELDLNSGVLKADILLGHTVDPIDLYPYMTGEITPDDIAGCVKNTYEKDGTLTRIGTNFTLKTVAGKSENLGDMTSWTLEQFLDYCDTLEDGEYIMDAVGQDNYASAIFGDTVHASFITDGEAYFDDGLYVRYLNFIASLPEKQLELMDYDAGSTLSQLIAGVITPEEVESRTDIEATGENLYYNNKIKLFNTQIQGNLVRISNLRGLLDTCNYFDSEDVTFIGYPTNGASGTAVSFIGDTYSIQSSCDHPELAWEFIESAVLAASVQPDEDTLLYEFTTLKEPYRDYLESLRGYRMCKSLERGSVTSGWELEIGDSPALLREVNDRVIGIITDLYNNAGNTDSVYSEVKKIAAEEESRFLAGVISAEECADIVQSRVSIYLAEKS